VRIRLLAVGIHSHPGIDDAVDFYAARLPRVWRFELTSLPAARADGRAREARLADEAVRLERVAGPDVTRVVLDREGRSLDSEGLAERLNGWLGAGRDIAFVVGGPDGVDAGFAQSAAFRWSLSKLTLPHHLARLVVAEQLYRASTILSGHPYHTGH